MNTPFSIHVLLGAVFELINFKGNVSIKNEIICLYTESVAKR
jgi:hypothetical protein